MIFKIMSLLAMMISLQSSASHQLSFHYSYHFFDQSETRLSVLKMADRVLNDFYERDRHSLSQGCTTGPFQFNLFGHFTKVGLLNILSYRKFELQEIYLAIFSKEGGAQGFESFQNHFLVSFEKIQKISHWEKRIELLKKLLAPTNPAFFPLEFFLYLAKRRPKSYGNPAVPGPYIGTNLKISLSCLNSSFYWDWSRET